MKSLQTLFSHIPHSVHKIIWQVYGVLFGGLLFVSMLVADFLHESEERLVFLDICLTFLSLAALFLYTVKQERHPTRFWRWVFGVSVGVTLVESLTRWFYTPFFAFLPRLVPSWGSWEIRLLNYLLALPLFYVLYALAFGKKRSRQPKASKQPYSDLAIASLVTGISGLFLPIILTLPSCILGILALQHLARFDLKGKVMAWYGIGIFLLQSLLLALGMGVALVLVVLPKPPVATGSNALSAMSPQETHYLHQNLEKITAESSLSDVVQLLGDPYGVINAQMVPHSRDEQNSVF